MSDVGVGSEECGLFILARWISYDIYPRPGSCGGNKVAVGFVFLCFWLVLATSCV